MPLYPSGTLILMLFPLLFIATVQCSDNATKGIEIPEIPSTVSCDRILQPQNVNLEFGYILSPRLFDETRDSKNQTHYNCTWLIQVQSSLTIKIIIQSLQLNYVGSHSLLFYDGYNTSSRLIQHLNQSLRTFTTFQSESNSLFIQYSGWLRYADTNAFQIYFEQSLPLLKCDSNFVQCRNQIRCVNRHKRCDDFDDCGDGTDEEDCYIYSNKTFSTSCGHRRKKHDVIRIVGGKASYPGEWPWVVSMRLKHHEPNGHTCGGTIISRSWIVTAAHCVKIYQHAEQWTIHAAKYQKLVHDQYEIVRYIKRIVVHPKFIGEDQIDNENLTWYDLKANDIALVELNAPLPTNNTLVSAACLPQTFLEVLPGELCYVVGWGDTYYTGNDLVLKETVVPVISNQVCRSWMPEFDIGPKMICAGYEQGGQDSCQGDSGGPLLMLDPNTTRYNLVGIVSTGGDICGAKREAGIYTRLTDFVEWIYNVTMLPVA